MERLSKQIYLSPDVEVIEVKTGQIICQSGDMKTIGRDYGDW